MPKKKAAVVSLALWTAILFYALSVGFLRTRGLFFLLLLSLLLFSLASVLSFIPAATCALRVFLAGRICAIRILAIACLLAVGGALVAIPLFTAGQDRAEIQEIEGILADDSRNLEADRIMARMRVDYSIGKGGTRTSSYGTLTVFLESGKDYQSIIPFEDLPRGTLLRLRGELVDSDRGDFFAATSFVVLSRPWGPALTRHRLRRTIIRRLESRPWGGMALALLLGWRDGLEDGRETLFRTAGVSHVLALSGMHLAVLSAILLIALKRPLGLIPSGLVSLLLLSLYLYLAGGQTSLMRALIMYAITLFALIRALPASSILILSLSFLLQLLATPLVALSPAFMLSYLALAGILVLSNPLSDLLPAFLPPVLRSPLAASIGAFLFALPVQALFFNVAYPAGMLASIPLAPLAGLMMIFGMAWPILNAVWSPLGLPLDFFARLCHSAMESIALHASRFPGVPLHSFPVVMIFSLSMVSAILLLNKTLCKRRRNRVLAP